MAGETYRDQTVWLCDLVRESILLDGVTFENCHILGPAVLVPFENDSFVRTTFQADSSPDDVLWEVPPTRKALIGAIPMRNCRMVSCKTTNVGFAGPKKSIDKFKSSVRSRDD